MTADLPATGTLKEGVHRLPLRVYYEDTDFSGVVYHASYLRFLERGRTEFIRALGIDQQRMYRETATAFVVRSVNVEFLRPALMDDVLHVETRVEEWRGPLLRLTQELTRAGALLISARVLVVSVREGRPVRLPADVQVAMRAAIAG